MQVAERVSASRHLDTVEKAEIWVDNRFTQAAISDPWIAAAYICLAHRKMGFEHSSLHTEWC